MKYTLYHGDCLTEMDKIPDKSIDAIIADLPYGQTACSWDSVIPFEPMWKQFKRVIKDRGAVVLFGSEPFSSLLRVSNLDWYKYDWVWDKGKAGAFTIAKYQPLRIVENISIFSESMALYNPQMTEAKAINKRPRNGEYKKKTNFLRDIRGGYFKTSEYHNEDIRYPTNILSFSSVVAECNPVNRIHPTQKPVSLLEYLVKTYTNPGDTVLDCVMGSGTTGAACGRLNRRFIGIEQDAGYFEIAKTRIMNAYDDFVRTAEEVARGQMALFEVTA